MRYITVLFLVLAGPASVIHGYLAPPKGPRKMPLELPDTFKMLESYTFAVAISDWDNDTVLECMYTYRTAIDPGTQTATFMVILPNTASEVPFHVKAGSVPGSFTFTIGEDPTEMEGIFYYANYGNCDVAYYDFHRPLCTLWTSRALKDNVPQDCIDHFVDICGVVVPAHSRDLCPDGEGDYR